MLSKETFLNRTYTISRYQLLFRNADKIIKRLNSKEEKINTRPISNEDDHWIGLYHYKYKSIPSKRAPHLAIYVRKEIDTFEVALNAEFKRSNLIIKDTINSKDFWQVLSKLTDFRIRIVPKRIRLRKDGQPFANKGNYEWLFEKPKYPKKQVYQDFPHYNESIAKILEKKDQEKQIIVDTLNKFSPDDTHYTPTFQKDDIDYCDNAYFAFNILREFKPEITGRNIIDAFTQLSEIFNYLADYRLVHNRRTYQ